MPPFALISEHFGPPGSLCARLRASSGPELSSVFHAPKGSVGPGRAPRATHEPRVYAVSRTLIAPSGLRHISKGSAVVVIGVGRG
jgi:hypothetical protein